MNVSQASISLAQLQAQGTLMGSSSGKGGDDSWENIFSLLVSNSSRFDPLPPVPAFPLAQLGSMNRGAINDCLPAGRNMALADPESAYKMMTVINYDEVLYKAQYSELSQMGAVVSRIEEAGASLGDIGLSTGNDRIKSRLADFVGQYNSWVLQFDPDVRNGGLLADTQAAEASRFELEQNINNRFFGIRDGVHGLGDLGIEIDSRSRLAMLDTGKLDALLASNKQGAVNAVHEFGANFAKSAALLNSEGNFILKQLDNLERAIHFIEGNKTSLQAEFGTGNAARPTGQVAQALAAYNRNCQTQTAEIAD